MESFHVVNGVGVALSAVKWLIWEAYRSEIFLPVIIYNRNTCVYRVDRPVDVGFTSGCWSWVNNRSFFFLSRQLAFVNISSSQLCVCVYEWPVTGLRQMDKQGQIGRLALSPSAPAALFKFDLCEAALADPTNALSESMSVLNFRWSFFRTFSDYNTSCFWIRVCAIHKGTIPH